MRNLSFCIIDGNLTRDPESRTIASGKMVVKFSLAMNDDYGDTKVVSYIPVECWGKTAENCMTYLKKGSRVTVQGNLREDRWEDDAGKKRSQIKVVASSVRFDSPRKKEGEADAQGEYPDDDGPDDPSKASF